MDARVTRFALACLLATTVLTGLGQPAYADPRNKRTDGGWRNA